MTIRKNYHGTCNVCGRESRFLERDHRVPPRLGGDLFHQANLQDICLECHKRKTTLEAGLMNFECTSAEVQEWLTMAFGADFGNMHGFADSLELRAHHVAEVAAMMKRKAETGQ